MDDGISNAEVQLCMALKNIRKTPFDREDLIAFGELAFKNDLQNWTSEFERFIQQCFIQPQDNGFTLTETGQTYIEKIIANEFFGKMLLRAEQSQTFATFCQRIYGKDLTQFGMTDMNELNQLLEVLELNESHRVLDIGCGIGRVTEFLSDETGAHITAIDSAENVIARAAHRTKLKSERLHFQVGDLNRLNFSPESFDTIVAIDTLYFAKDLTVVIADLKRILKPGGQMGLFFSDVITPAESPDHLKPESTKLACALKAHDLSFTTYDFNEDNKIFWQRSVEIAKELQPAFIKEGNKDLCDGRIIEGSAVLDLATAGRMCRYLYHVRV